MPIVKISIRSFALPARIDGLFGSLIEICVAFNLWLDVYNTVRPHGARWANARADYAEMD